MNLRTCSPITILALLLLLCPHSPAAPPIDVAKGEACKEGDLIATVITYAPNPNDSAVVEIEFANKGEKRLDLNAWDRRLESATLVDGDGTSYLIIRTRREGRFWSSGKEVLRHPGDPNAPLPLNPGRTLTVTMRFGDKITGAATLEIPGPDRDSVVAFKLPAKLKK